MSDENKDIFDSMKDKLDKNKFEFNEKHWDKMEKMLDDDPKPVGFFTFKNIGRIALISLLFIGAIFTFRTLKNKEELSSATRTNTEETKETKNTNSISNNEEGSNNEKIALNNSQQNQTIENDSVSNKNNSEKQIVSKLITNKNDNYTNKSDNKTSNYSNQNKAYTQYKSNSEGIKSNEEKLSNQSSSLTLEAKESNNNVVIISKKDQLISNSEENNIKSLNEEEINHNEPNNKVINNNPNDSQKETSNEIFVQTTEDIVKNSIIEPNSNISNDSISVLDSTLVQIDSLTLVKLDSTLSKDTSDIDSTILNSGLFIVGGSNFYQGYLNNGTKRINSIDPEIGIVYEIDINPKIGILVGINYFTKSQLNSMKDYKYTTYGFGLEEEIVTIEAKRINFGKLSLGTYFRINNNLKFNLSATTDYILNTKIKETTQIYTTLNGTSSNSVIKIGNSNGFQNYSFGIKLGILYKISNKLYTNLNYNYGLTDITLNDYFNNSISDRNKGVQVKLSYLIYKREKIVK